MHHGAMDNRWRLEAMLVRKAAEDLLYRRDLLFRSKEVLEREIGEGLPEDVAVIVLNERPGEVILVLPYEGHQALGEIDVPADEEDGAPSSAGTLPRIAVRATRDAAFRKQLATDPLLLYPEQARPAPRRAPRLRMIQETDRVVQLVIPSSASAAMR